MKIGQSVIEVYYNSMEIHQSKVCNENYLKPSCPSGLGKDQVRNLLIQKLQMMKKSKWVSLQVLFE